MRNRLSETFGCSFLLLLVLKMVLTPFSTNSIWFRVIYVLLNELTRTLFAAVVWSHSNDTVSKKRRRRRRNVRIWPAISQFTILLSIFIHKIVADGLLTNNVVMEISRSHWSQTDKSVPKGCRNVELSKSKIADQCTFS